MKAKVLIFVALLLVGGRAVSIEITWQGSPPDSRRYVERRLRSQATDRAQWGGMTDSAKQWLQADGYADAVATLRDSTLIISAGPLVLIDAVVADEDTLAVRGALPFTSHNLDSVIAIFLRARTGQGFYYAQAPIAGIARSGDRVTIQVTVDDGPMVRVVRLNYAGLKRTPPAMLERYLPMRPGDALTESALQRLERQAARIPHVRYLPPAQVEALPGYTDAALTLHFAEKRQFSLSGGVGYEGERDAALVWNLDLNFVNLFGGGRDIRIVSDHRDRDRNRLEVAYSQPLFLLGRDRLEAAVATRDYRDDFYEFRLGVGYAAELSEAFTSGLALGWKRVDPAGIGQSYSAWSAEYSVRRQSLEDSLNPAGGYDIGGSLTYAYRRYTTGSGTSMGEGGVFNETVSRLSARFFQRLRGPLIGTIEATYLGLETGQTEPPTAELFLIGGAPTLRGYRTEQFAAQRAALVTVEPRIRFQLGYGFLFYDGAYLNRRQAASGGGSETEEWYRSGLGFGMALISPQRMVKLSLAWGRGDRFDEPRLALEFRSDL